VRWAKVAGWVVGCFAAWWLLSIGLHIQRRYHGPGLNDPVAPLVSAAIIGAVVAVVAARRRSRHPLRGVDPKTK
jgi:hypothetical protein